MRKRSMKQLQAAVDKFNTEFPVGTDVIVTQDSGDDVASRVRYPASILGGHTAVGWFDGIVGCYDITRVRAAR